MLYGLVNVYLGCEWTFLKLRFISGYFSRRVRVEVLLLKLERLFGVGCPGLTDELLLHNLVEVICIIKAQRLNEFK